MKSVQIIKWKNLALCDVTIRIENRKFKKKHKVTLRKRV